MKAKNFNRLRRIEKFTVKAKVKTLGQVPSYKFSYLFFSRRMAGLSFITFFWKVMKNKDNPVNPVNPVIKEN
ncbi:MAG: hypothetical protein OET63_14985 [Desulfobacterales bacterium]|jgi:hypothetical protein|nr:hypothetical protein [Desulfobacterales bacterium]